MFLLHEYDIFWAFLIISSVIPILTFVISGVLAPVSEGPEKLSSYESGIEPTKEGKGGWLRQCSPFSQEYEASNYSTLFPVGGQKLRKAFSKGGRREKKNMVCKAGPKKVAWLLAARLNALVESES